MKLHDLRPAEGSRKDRIRVGRGIAAGKGKTAGRGTKGQKARAGGSIPPWFEGGQTPLHMRIPKLRGFKNRFKVEYEVVNIGAIAARAEQGAFESDETRPKGRTAAPLTINQDILRAVGLVRTLNKPLKILGNGELSTALFVVADAFTATARAKIEAAGGSVNVLEVPSTPLAAIGIEPAAEAVGTSTRDRNVAAAKAGRAADKARRIADRNEATGGTTPAAAPAPAAAAAAPKVDADIEPASGSAVAPDVTSANADSATTELDAPETETESTPRGDA
jgi:large subunit ribosomal protein L15